MPDLRQFANTLSRIMPFLAQEKMQRENIRRWLESNLQELAAREASEGRTILARGEETGRAQARGAAYNIEDIFGKGIAEGLKGKPGAMDLLAQRLKVGLPGSTAGIVEDPNAAARINEERTAVFNLFSPAMTKMGLPREVQGSIINNMSDSELRQFVVAQGGQTLEEKQLAKDIEGQKIRREELAFQKEGLKGGGAKDAAAAMKEAQNDIDLATKQYAGVGSFLTASPDAKKALTAIIKKANNRIDTAAKSLGIESPIKNRQEMLEDGLSILSRYAATGAFPRSYDLILMGYDPDFVFGLEDSLKKSDKKVEPTERERMNKALAMIKAILEGKVE